MKKILFIIAILGTIVGSQFYAPKTANADIVSNEVIRSAFDEGSGTTATDGSGNGNNGTLTNGATYTSSSKIGPYALSLDGTNDYVTYGNVAAITNPSAFTACSWIYTTNTTADHYIMNKAGVASQGFIMFFDDVGQAGRTDTITFLTSSSLGVGARTEAASNSVPANTWVHVCGTWVPNSSTGMHLYVNGTEDANSPVSTIGQLDMQSTLSDFNVGRRSDGIYWIGRIDETRVYNRALSAADVLELYNYTGGSPPAATAGEEYFMQFE